MNAPKMLKPTVMIALGCLALAGCERSQEKEKAAGSESETAAVPAAPARPAEETPPATPALSPNEAAIARGAALAEANCTSCHATQPGERSADASAPSFATLFTNYPPEYIAEAFAEGVFVGHGDMPAFEFSPAQINDLIAYLKTLGPPG